MPYDRRYSDEVHDADNARRRAEITWDAYGDRLKGKMSDPASMTIYMEEFARGVRDRAGRLRELEDLGGRTSTGDRGVGPGDTGTGPGDT